jgi:hypothetical protein
LPADSSATICRTPRIYLNSLELALLAMFNNEMAEACDEEAEDPELRPETRETVRDSAARYRERARSLQSAAQMVGTHPASVTVELTPEQPVLYAGPERRKGERRIRERRGPRSLAPGELGHAERRINPDRRQRERRVRAGPVGRDS